MGRGLAILADHSPGFANDANYIAGRWGVSFGGYRDHRGSSPCDSAVNFFPHPITDGINAIETNISEGMIHYRGSSSGFSVLATKLTSGNHDTLLAALLTDTFRVFFDASFVRYLNGRVSRCQSRKLVHNISCWLEPGGCGCVRCTTSLDSVWFFEETDCDERNIVLVCYILNSTCPGSSFIVDVSVSPDSGRNWLNFGSGWFRTFYDTAGDVGDSVSAGPHCFSWDLGLDLPDTESMKWAVEVRVSRPMEGGEWPMFQYDCMHTGRSPYNCCHNWLSIDTMWSVDLGERIMFPAVYKDTVIYVATVGGRLHAIKFDGTLLWTARIGSTSYSGPVLLNDGSIVIGNQANQVVQVRPDGTIGWRWTSPNNLRGIRHCPIIGFDDRIYTVGYYTSDWHGHLLCFTQSGTFIWDRSLPGGGSWIYSSPAMDEDTLIFTVDYTNSPGELVCYNSSSTVLWRFNTYPHSGETDLRSSPTVDTVRNRVYFGSNKNNPRGMVAVDYSRTAATLAWFYNVGAGNNINCSPAIDTAGNIYFGTSNGTFYSLTPSGALRWTFRTGGAISDPVIDPSGCVIFGSADSNLYIVSAATGSLLYSINLGSSVVSPIISQSGIIYVGTASGKFYALGCGLSVVAELADTAYGPVDSRPPRISISCPETAVFLGEPAHLSWHVEDMFWANDPCTVRINMCGTESVIVVADTALDFVAPIDLPCDSAVVYLSVRDSFCNWGHDTCIIRFMPPGYISLYFGDTIASACRTTVVPLYVDSSDCMLDILIVTFSVDTTVVYPTRFVPTVTPAPDSFAMNRSGERWNLEFYWSTRTRINTGVVGFLHLRANCAVSAGYYSIIDIEDVHAHLADAYWRDGTVLIDYNISPWLVTLHIDDLTSEAHTEVTFGANYGSTDGYDPWVDLLHLAPPPGSIDAWFDIDDPSHPAVRKLYRDVRDMVVPDEWHLVISNPSSVRVHWRRAALGEGFYTINGLFDMRSDTQYYAAPFETLTITWDLQRLCLDTVRMYSGWNLY